MQPAETSNRRSNDPRGAYPSERLTNAPPVGGPTEAAASVAAEDPWPARTRIFLQPVAAPSVLGLFGFFAATVMVGSNLAGWWGTSSSGLYLFEFAAIFGGVAQFAAAMWAYRARDAAATAVHGAWGSFWIGYGILQLLVATKVLAAPGLVSAPLGWWFIGLAAVTASVTLAALAESLAVTAVAGTLTAGSILAAVGYYAPSLGALRAGGVLFVISAAIAWYVATAMMLAASFGRTILPLFTWSRAANVPWREPYSPIERPAGMPGVRVGQG
jgi:succinate-acetate transporter protein